MFALQVAGWVGIWVAFVAFYVATAILTGEVWDYVSPPTYLSSCLLWGAVCGALSLPHLLSRHHVMLWTLKT